LRKADNNTALMCRLPGSLRTSWVCTGTDLRLNRTASYNGEQWLIFNKVSNICGYG